MSTPSRHPEEYCHRCGGKNISWSAPSPLWNAVMRGNDINGREEFDGIVCPVFFAELAEEKGIATGFKFYAQKVNIELQTVTPSGRMWNEKKWSWV